MTWFIRNMIFGNSFMFMLSSYKKGDKVGVCKNYYGHSCFTNCYYQYNYENLDLLQYCKEKALQEKFDDTNLG